MTHQRLTVEGNTIIDSVIAKLVASFPNIDVYDERINEGCEYPYFMVYVEDFSEQKLVGQNYLQTFIISVIYQYKELPETSYSNFNVTGYKLAEELELITLPNGDLLRGYNKNFYPDKQKLEFYINYDIKVEKEKQSKPKMLHSDINVYTKIGGN